MDAGEGVEPVSDLGVSGTVSSVMQIGELTYGSKQGGGGVLGERGDPTLQFRQLVIKARERDLTRAGRRLVWPWG
ncbi:hypothetical protein A4G27_02290 [Mycobacterium kansasii]|nr:hypothetical protein A4G27_02290 [Mycobacterium kansasii]